MTSGAKHWVRSFDTIPSNSYSGIGITEHTEYSQKNRLGAILKTADVTKIDVLRPMSASAQLSRQKTGENYQKNTITSYSVYSKQTAIPRLFSQFCYRGTRIDGILFRSFRNQNRSQKNTITVSSVYSHSGIVPKGRDISDTSAQI